MCCIEGDLEGLKNIVENDTKLYPIDLNFKEFDEMTSLHYACQENNFEIVKYLIEKKVNLDA